MSHHKIRCIQVIIKTTYSAGELCVRGYSVMLGYWDNAAATQQVLLLPQPPLFVMQYCQLFACVDCQMLASMTECAGNITPRSFCYTDDPLASLSSAIWLKQPVCCMHMHLPVLMSEPLDCSCIGSQAVIVLQHAVVVRQWLFCTCLSHRAESVMHR